MSSTGNRTNRRDLLKGTAALAPMVALAGSRALADGRIKHDDWATSAPGPAHFTAADYKPTFFTAEEYAFLIAACSRLIPQDEHGPGATELGVPQYIDRQMVTPWADGGIWYMQGPFFTAKPEFGYQASLTPKQQFQQGIKAIDAVCQKQFQKPFAGLTPAQQDELLKGIEKGTVTSPDLPLKTFFTSFLLKTVMEGYFGDPMYGGNKDMAAWTMIAYPGVRADYLEWVGEAKPYPYGPVSIYGARG